MAIWPWTFASLSPKPLTATTALNSTSGKRNAQGSSVGKLRTMEVYLSVRHIYSEGYLSTWTILCALEMSSGGNKLLEDLAEVAGGRGLWAQFGGHIRVSGAALPWVRDAVPTVTSWKSSREQPSLCRHRGHSPCFLLEACSRTWEANHTERQPVRDPQLPLLWRPSRVCCIAGRTPCRELRYKFCGQRGLSLVGSRDQQLDLSCLCQHAAWLISSNKEKWFGAL